MAKQIDADSSEEVGSEGDSFPPDGTSDGPFRSGIEGGTACHRDRKRRGVAHHDAAWAVRKPDTGEVQSIDVRCGVRHEKLYPIVNVSFISDEE